MEAVDVQEELTSKRIYRRYIVSEHRHEWFVDKPDSLFPFRCKECGDGASLGWAISHLNAVERLSGATARNIADSVEMNSVNYVLKHVHRLHAYAVALGSEDG